jgi:type II secretory pathway pseudopilin PulG
MFKMQTNSNDQNTRQERGPVLNISSSDFGFVSDCPAAPAQQRELRISDFRRRRGGFSLTELLIVIGIIILALALAVPALNLITGAKSTEQAQNITSIMLAQARNEAIGLQQYRGLFFYLDPADGRVKMAMVREVDPPAASSAPTGVDVYLDLVPDRDVTSLPSGTSLQVLDDARENSSGVAQNDRYIGFNTVSGVGSSYAMPAGKIKTPYGGVILFDARGQLVSRVYALQTHRTNPLSSNTEFTPMGVLLLGIDPTDTYQNEPDVVPVDPSVAANRDRVIRSAMGFVIFDAEAFKNAAGTPDDDQVKGTAYLQPEKDEEAWLDDNGKSLLINRYNGALVKGE